VGIGLGLAKFIKWVLSKAALASGICVESETRKRESIFPISRLGKS